MRWPRYAFLTLCHLLLSVPGGQCAQGPPAAGLSKELRACLARAETESAVGRGALLICKEEYPDLDVNANLEQLAAMGRRLSAEVSKADTPSRKLGALAGLNEALGKAADTEKPALLQRIGVCYGKLQNHRKAYDAAEQLLKLSPRDLPGLRVSAAACEGLQNRQQAVEFYRRILDIEPEDAQAKAALVRLEPK